MLATRACPLSNRLYGYFDLPTLRGAQRLSINRWVLLLQVVGIDTLRHLCCEIYQQFIRGRGKDPMLVIFHQFRDPHAVCLNSLLILFYHALEFRIFLL